MINLWFLHGIPQPKNHSPQNGFFLTQKFWKYSCTNMKTYVPLLAIGGV